MYAMNLNFKFDFTNVKKMAYYTRKLQKLLYLLQWGEQVCAKAIMMRMTGYPLKKKCVCQHDPKTPDYEIRRIQPVARSIRPF